MSNTIAYVDNQTLTNIADAVRYKTGTNGKMLLNEIPDKIRNIEGIIPSGSIEVTENGTYDVTTKQAAFVNVSSQVPITESLSITQNGTYIPPSGVDGFDEVVVNVPVSEWPAPTLVYEGDFAAGQYSGQGKPSCRWSQICRGVDVSRSHPRTT